MPNPSNRRRIRNGTVRVVPEISQEAYAVLEEVAQNSRTSLAAVAKQILEAAAIKIAAASSRFSAELEAHSPTLHPWLAVMAMDENTRTWTAETRCCHLTPRASLLQTAARHIVTAIRFGYAVRESTDGISVRLKKTREEISLPAAHQDTILAFLERKAKGLDSQQLQDIV